MRRPVFRRLAADDIARAYAWYERRREGLGEEFLERVPASVDAVLQNAAGYPVLHRHTRRALVSRFPYGLLYRIDGDVVVFVACFHTRRRPPRGGAEPSRARTQESPRRAAQRRLERAGTPRTPHVAWQL